MDKGLTLEMIDDMMEIIENEGGTANFIPFTVWTCVTCKRKWQSLVKRSICIECAMKLDDRIHLWNGIPIIVSEYVPTDKS